MGKVLILGTALSAKPMTEYFIGNGYNFVIASPTKGRADEIIGGNALGASVDWSMDDPEALEMLIAGNDITVSLLPYKYHPEVARLCLRQGKPMVTTSYIQKEMQGFHQAAKDAGLLFLNETGLEPGIDHMSAMRIIDDVHANGGIVEEFYSMCGALPAPEAANNPMKYKFTWSPKGIINASLGNAMYLRDGKNVLTDEKNLFKDVFSHRFPPLGSFQVHPNRDSLSYTVIYNIPEARTIYRGTFRYSGWCETLDAMKALNMFDETVRDYTGYTYSAFLAERAGLSVNDLKRNIMALIGASEDSPAIRSFEFLGFFSDEKISYFETTPFEITSDRMISKMMLGPDERDMVIMQHVLLISWPDSRKEVIRSSMLHYGEPHGNTAISMTIGLPAAIAVKLIVEKKINIAGVHRPVHPEIYNPVLDELRRHGIVMKEEYGLPESEMIRPDQKI